LCFESFETKSGQCHKEIFKRKTKREAQKVKEIFKLIVKLKRLNHSQQLYQIYMIFL